VPGTCVAGNAEFIVPGTCVAGNAEFIVPGTCVAGNAEFIVPGTCVAGGRIKPGARAPGTSFKKGTEPVKRAAACYWTIGCRPFHGLARQFWFAYLGLAPQALFCRRLRRLLFCPQFADYCSVLSSPTIVLSSVRRLCSSRRFADDVLSSALPTVQFLGKFCVLYSSNLRTVSRTW
jgi:hypothetical protein